MTRKAIVAGALANKPGNAGGAWERFSYAVGLRRLGFDVLFVEQMNHALHADALDWFDVCIRFFGFENSFALIDHEGCFIGRDRNNLRTFARECECLMNLSGHITLKEIVESVPLSVFIDVDPGFTQIWHVNATADFAIPRHDHYYTLGENIGTAECPIPMGGLPWRTTRQPVLLHRWPVTPIENHQRFTTISSWRSGFGAVALNGSTYSLKHHECRKVLLLPQRVDATFEIALDIHKGDHQDRDALNNHGWHILEPSGVVSTPETFRDYIQQSAAEFSVAQGVYARTNSGWFSDRSTRYLASGKPVLVQDTGITTIPIGEGIVTFKTLDDAVAGAESILRDYDRHAKAARWLAETYFDSDKVLGTMLAEIGIPVSETTR
ncbi:hypothetical protein BH11PLA2_BH11PLA2_17650 [soil metagenome]